MKRVPVCTICAAKESDMGAIKSIIRHFKRHITLRCLTYHIGADGHDHIIVDVDLRDQASPIIRYFYVPLQKPA